jgi:hypothetical protein
MDIASRAKAVLARLTARRHGRPVPLADLEEALTLEGMDARQAHHATQALLDARAAVETTGGLLPTSPPLATRAPNEVASFSRLHR